jgi:PAS domain-containing protein
MTDKVNNNSFKKIIIMVLLAIFVFLVFIAYSLNSSVVNSQRLKNIKIAQYPVLERVDANVVHLDKIKELFLQAVMSAEEDIIDEAKEHELEAVKIFREIKTIEPVYQKEMDLLIAELENYFKISTEASLYLIEESTDKSTIKEKVQIMNTALAKLKKNIADFHDHSYNMFSTALDESNNSAIQNMYMAIGIGLMNLAFMLVLVYFIRNNIVMMAIIEKQNKTLELRVQERTKQLAQKTKDINVMLDNMPLGVFTLINQNQIHPEYSSFLEIILENDKLSGCDIFQCLFDKCNLGANALDQVKTSLSSIIGENELNYFFNEHLLVNEVLYTSRDGTNKILNLNWNAISSDDGVVDKVLVTANDITELRKIELKAKEQQKELAIVSQILKISIGKFNNFIESSFNYLDENEELIKQTSTRDQDVIATLFRNMHTVKGNARTYEFHYLTDIIHEVEQTYSHLKTDDNMLWDAAVLMDELELAKETINMYVHINEDILGRKGRASDQLTNRGCFVSNQHLDELKLSVTLLSGKYQDDSEIKDIHRRLKRIEQVPLQRLIDGAIDSISSLAKELQKPSPAVIIHDLDISIHHLLCEPLKSSFMHIVRNSLDHGIEIPDERIAANKTPAGTITFEVIAKDDHVELHISDDGKGIALHKLYQKAIENNIIQESDNPSMQTVANLLFNSGLSTAEKVTQVSGRGVGMDAVRSFLQKQDVKIEIALQQEATELTFTPFEFIIFIDEKLYTL